MDGSNTVGTFRPANEPAKLLITPLQLENIPVRRKDDAHWQDDKGIFWLYGGYSVASGGYLSDLWKFENGTSIWVRGDKQVNPAGLYGEIGIGSAGSKPGSRYVSFNWGDRNGSLWLMGGYGYSSHPHPGQLNDMWKYQP